MFPRVNRLVMKAYLVGPSVILFLNMSIEYEVIKIHIKQISYNKTQY